MDNGPTIDFTPSSGFAVRSRSAPEPIESDVEKVLNEARRLIARREDWGQGNYHVIRGRRCAVKAICDASAMLDAKSAGNVAGDLLDAVARQRGYVTTERMNDGSTHDQVLVAFDEAIVVARRMTDASFS